MTHHSTAVPVCLVSSLLCWGHEVKLIFLLFRPETKQPIPTTSFSVAWIVFVEDAGNGCATFCLSTYNLLNFSVRALTFQHKVPLFVCYKDQCFQPLQLFHRIQKLMSNTRSCAEQTAPLLGHVVTQPGESCSNKSEELQHEALPTKVKLR